MSWEKFVTLFCDAEDCDSACSTGRTRVAEAREVAPDWTYVDGQDLCGSCSREREVGPWA